MPLTAVDPWFINAPGGDGPEYNAEELRRDLGYLLTGGASPGTPRGGLLDPRALDITISGSDVQLATTGGASLPTTKGTYITGASDLAKIDTLVTADSTNPRRDRVVLVVLDPDNGAAGTNRRAEFRVVTGTADAAASTGGGYPPEPSGVSSTLTLGYVDVPKQGAGSPVFTKTATITSAAGAPVLVKTQTDADALPRWDGAIRLLGYLPERPLQVCNGTVWKTVSPPLRTDFDVTTVLVNRTGTATRLIADLPLATKPYARLMRIQSTFGATAGSIASGVQTIYGCGSFMQSTAGAAQGKSPLSWNSPGGFTQGGFLDSGWVLVPANTPPLARLWVMVTSGSVNVTVSNDPSIMKVWVDEKPADA